MGFIVKCLLLLQLISAPDEVELSNISPDCMQQFEQLYHRITFLEDNHIGYSLTVEQTTRSDNKLFVKVIILYGDNQQQIIVFEDLEL